MSPVHVDDTESLESASPRAKRAGSQYDALQALDRASGVQALHAWATADYWRGRRDEEELETGRNQGYSDGYVAGAQDGRQVAADAAQESFGVIAESLLALHEIAAHGIPRSKTKRVALEKKIHQIVDQIGKASANTKYIIESGTSPNEDSNQTLPPQEGQADQALTEVGPVQ
jgi:flagellar biosynthesis/type III secretory pathway protein FliH